MTFGAAHFASERFEVAGPVPFLTGEHQFDRVEQSAVLTRLALDTQPIAPPGEI